MKGVSVQGFRLRGLGFKVTEPGRGQGLRCAGCVV